jgi:serine/threonine protein phosphatase PrpC
MTAEPSIVHRKLKPNDMFLIFASDGLWEHLSDEAAVEIVFKNPRVVSACQIVFVLCSLIFLCHCQVSIHISAFYHYNTEFMHLYF